MDYPYEGTWDSTVSAPAEEKPCPYVTDSGNDGEDSTVVDKELCHSAIRSGKTPDGTGEDLSSVIPPPQGIHRGNSNDAQLPEELESRIVLPETRPEDLFEWEKLTCDTPYHLQGDESFETPEKQAARQALKTHPDVEAALEHIWGLFSKDDQERVTKREYCRVLLRICLVLVPQLRGRQVMDLIEEEWHRDSKGEQALSRPAFFECFFQLADIWTPTIEGCAYAEFITRLFRRITVKKASIQASANVTKIRPKIVVKVLNKGIQKPEAQQQNQEDAQQVDLVVGSGKATRCVAEWSKTEHEAVEALVVAHMSGEKELKNLELQEEVLHDCSEVSAEEPLSSEWADFASIAPIGAASKAFLESVFSRSLAAIRQVQPQLQPESRYGTTPQPTATSTTRSDGKEQREEKSPPEASEPAAQNFPLSVVLRHFADYRSTSDLPLRVTGVSEEELRPFNSIGLPVQMEGMQKLVRLKRGDAALLQPQVKEREQHEEQERQKAQLVATEQNKSVYQIEDSQAALFQDLQPFGGDEPLLEEMMKRLPPNDEAEPAATILHTEPEQEQNLFPEPESLPNPAPEPEEESLDPPQKETPESTRESPLDDSAKPQFEKVSTPPAELREPLVNDRTELQSEEVSNPPAELKEPPLNDHSEHQSEAVSQPPAGIEGPVAVAKDTQIPPAVQSCTASLRAKTARRPGPFKTRVFHSLCDDSLRQWRAKSFRRSIIITGVGTVAVRRRSDFMSLRRNLFPLDGRELEPEVEKDPTSDEASLCLKFEGEGDFVSGEEQLEDDMWLKRYTQPEDPPAEDAILVTDEDEVAFAQQPRQAIVIVGPNGPEKSRMAYKLATSLGLEWLQAEYLLSALCKISRSLLTPLGRRLTRMMRQGSPVPTLEALLLTLEFMASKRSRSAGYVLELPNGDKQDINIFLRHLRDLSGRRRLNWPELLLRHAHICEQRRRRRREKKRRKHMETEAPHMEQQTPAYEFSSAEAAARIFEDKAGSEVRQLVSEGVGKAISVFEGPSVSEPQTIDFLGADEQVLASEKGGSAPAPEVREGSASVENIGTDGSIKKGQSWGGDEESKLEGSKEASLSVRREGQHDSLQFKEALDRESLTEAELERHQSFTDNDQSGVVSTDPSHDVHENSETVLALEAEAGKCPENPSPQELGNAEQVVNERGEAAKQSEKASRHLVDEHSGAAAALEEQAKGWLAPSTEADLTADKPLAVTVDNNAPLPAAVEGFHSEYQSSSKHSGVNNDGGMQPKNVPQESRLTDDEGFELYSSDPSDSDSEADELFQIAAKDESQPQANPLMDAFPGRAVFLQLDPKDGSRTLMVDTANGTVVDEFRTHDGVGQEGTGDISEEDEESETDGELVFDAKSDVLEEIKKAVPPNLGSLSAFDVALAKQTEDQIAESLSQRILLHHLLQLLGPNRVIFFPPGEDQAQDDSAALETQVVMAGPRVAAALEFLSVRPPGEIAVPVPGAAEAEELRDLLQRVELPEDETPERDTENDLSDGNEEDKAEEEASATAGDLPGRDRKLSETNANSINNEAKGSLESKTPPKKYQMADDLWGESQLEIPNERQTTAVGDIYAKDVFSPSPTEEFWEQDSQNGSSATGPTDQLQQLLDRRWTAWGEFCPVSLMEEGKIVEGQKQFAVEFAGKIFLLGDEEKYAKFLRDPKRYVDTPPTLPPTTSVYLFGPSYAGASKQARLLSHTYGLSTVDVLTELTEGHHRVVDKKQRLLEEEERREAERLLQERIQKQLQQETEERNLMRAEDDTHRFSLSFTAAVDETPDEFSPTRSETMETRRAIGGADRAQPFSVSTGSSGTFNFVRNNVSSLAALPTDVVPVDEFSKGECEAFEDGEYLTSPEEEKLLQEGQALGVDTVVRLVVRVLGVAENLQRADAIDKYRVELESYDSQYGRHSPEDNGERGENSEAEDDTGDSTAVTLDGDEALAALPRLPVAPPPLLKLAKGFVVVSIPPTQELLQKLARVGVVFDYLIHLTSNPKDVEEAEAAGAAQYAFNDSEIIFEDETKEAEIDPAEKELEIEADKALTFDIDVEPTKIEASLTDLLKHYRIRQLLDPFMIKPDSPDRVKAPPDLEEIYARINQITSLEYPPEGEDWANASKNFPFLPPLPLVLYGDVGGYCPVTLRDERWLLPGKPQLNLQVRQRVYTFFDEEKRYKFAADTRRYLPSLDKCNDANETSTFKVPPPRIAFLGTLGSEMDKRVLQLSAMYAVPILDLPTAFSRAISKQLLVHMRQEKRVELEQALADPGPEKTGSSQRKEDSAVWQLLSLNSSSFLNAPADEVKQLWLSLQKETQQTLCEKAIRSILHPLMGPAFIQASVFKNPLHGGEGTPLEQEEADDTINIGELMDKSGRLPDCVVIFLCSDEVGVSRCLDLEKIDRDAQDIKRRKETERRLHRESRKQAAGVRSGADGDVAEGQSNEGTSGNGEGDESYSVYSASEQAREAFLKKKALQEAMLLQSAKSFAIAGVPVLTVRSELCEETLLAAVKHFLSRFLNYRRSLMLSPQCIPLPKPFCQRLLRARSARLSMYELCSPMDIDSMRLKDSTKYPVLFRDRIYFPGDTEEARRIFCQIPSKFLTGEIPPPYQYVPACVFLGPLNSNRSQVARQIAEWCGSLHISLLQLMKEIGKDTSAPTSLGKRIADDLQNGKPAAPCCISRLLAARLRSHEAKQRGYMLDGCGMEGVDVQELLTLLHAGPEEAMILARKHSCRHCSLGDCNYMEVSASSFEAHHALIGPTQESSPPCCAAPYDPLPESSTMFPKEAGSAVMSPRECGSVHFTENRKSATVLRATVPPLKLSKLKPASPGLPGPYTLSASPRKGTFSGSETPVPSEASVESLRHRSVPETMPIREVEFSCAAVEPPKLLVDTAFVFEPECEDSLTMEERLLAEEGQEPTNHSSATRLRYLYEDDRDILVHVKLAEERRLRQEAATLLQVEAFRSRGVRIVKVPAGKSEWFQFDTVKKEIEGMLRRRHSYERLKAQGKAARCPIGEKVTAAHKTPFETYCPVCWTVDNALRECSSTLEFQVEFRTALFFCCSEKHAELILCNPELYIHHRLPDLLPHRLSPEKVEMRDAVALKGYCAVTLVSSGELVQGDRSLLVAYGKRTFCFASQEALELFMLYPADYASRAQLPARLSGSQRLLEPVRTLASIAHAARERSLQKANADGPSSDPLLNEEGLAELRETLQDGLTYIEISSLDLLIEALLFAGKSRLLYPKCSQPASAVRLVAHYLQAKNPLLFGHVKIDAEAALSNFLKDCETPFEARKAILHLHYYMTTKGKNYLSAEQLYTYNVEEVKESHTAEWTHLSEIQYTKVTRRLDDLFHIN